jgi:hypothetical protein
MPQIRVSEEAYRLLKERAKRERRTLSNMVEVLLTPCVLEEGVAVVGTVPTLVHRMPTPDDNLPTRVDSPPTSALSSGCTCGPGERAKGKHNKWCPMRGK